MYSGSHAVISNGMSILRENVFQIHEQRANIVFQLQNTNDFCYVNEIESTKCITVDVS